MPVMDKAPTVKRIDVSATLPAGRFRNAIRVLATTSLGGWPDTKWQARDTGAVEGRMAGGGVDLAASTLTP